MPPLADASSSTMTCSSRKRCPDTRHPDTHPYVFVDDIAIRAADSVALLDTLNHLYHVAYRMGLRFNADKTETYTGRVLMQPEP